MTSRGPNPPPARARTRGSAGRPTEESSTGAGTRPARSDPAANRDVVQSVAGAGGFVPTGTEAPRPPRGRGKGGAGLPRGPMETRAGPQGWGQVCGAGPGSGGANERAPRPGPAGARDAAERLVLL